MRNPKTRTDHPNPRVDLLSMLFGAMGKTTPAAEDPLDAIPIAIGRFWKKYWLVVVTAGV
jgi:hypothetical protein